MVLTLSDIAFLQNVAFCFDLYSRFIVFTSTVLKPKQEYGEHTYVMAERRGKEVSDTFQGKKKTSLTFKNKMNTNCGCLKVSVRTAQ